MFMESVVSHVCCRFVRADVSRGNPCLYMWELHHQCFTEHTGDGVLVCKDVLVCGEIHKSIHSMIIVSIVNFLKSFIYLYTYTYIYIYIYIYTYIYTYIYYSFDCKLPKEYIWRVYS